MMAFDLNMDKHKKVHFIGIGGVSMSGLAAVLLTKGYKVSGSDSKESEVLNKLREANAEIYIGHKKENLRNVDLVVYTAAIPSDNPEIIEAKAQNIELMDRAEFLGYIMKGHKYNVAVAGTHGKTTTTSMLSHITLEANLDPTILVGGDVDAIHGNYKIGESEYFVTEACEYKASFLKFYPYIGIILNIDADHLDYYRDINHIEDTFKKFSDLIPADGYLVGCAEDHRVMEVLNYAKCKTMSYGFDKGDVTAGNISFNNKGCATFTVFHNGKELFDVTLNTTGKHNILNALATICTSLILEIPNEAIINGLAACKGAHKRFEYKGEVNGVTVIDDYAHHPTEINATLTAAKEYPHKEIWCIFQPHTYTRTKALFPEFVDALTHADHVILADIYAARETDTLGMSSEMIAEELKKKGCDAYYFPSFEEIENFCLDKCQKGDVLITMGAGNVVNIGENLLKR